MDFVLLSKIDNLVFELKELFYLYNDLTIKDIKNYLDKAKKFYSIEEIKCAINILLVDYGIIVRDDFWEKDAVYHYVANRYYQDSAFTRHYYSFTVDNTSNKKILLISDTHIGNPELENFSMLHNIYDYALKKGVNKCFHLGDIFSRLDYDKWDREKIEKQLALFGRYYPDCAEIDTYSLIGNHDEYFNGFLTYDKIINIPIEYDLRQLSRYVSNFYVIPRTAWNIDFSNVKMHLSHKLYLNWMIRDKKLNNLEEMKYNNFFDGMDYNLLISGHLHQGFIYNYVCNKQDHLLLGVPSATRLNQNGVVAYIVSLNYNDLGEVDYFDVSLLLSDDNNKIYEGETINWNFQEKNKSLKKTF